MAHCFDLGLEWLLNLSSFLNFCQNRYGTETSAENKQNSVKKIENQEKKMINQEKRPFRIRDKYIDRDSEYLLQENEPDVTLDQQLLEDLQKKKTDLRYIEMQVMGSKMGEIFTCHLSLSFFFFFPLKSCASGHMEVPRPGVKLEMQWLAYATATATPEPSCVCDLHHSSWQRWIFNP